MANEKLAIISIHLSRERERERQRTDPHTKLIMIMTFKLKVLAHAKVTVTMLAYYRWLPGGFKVVVWVVAWALWVVALLFIYLFLGITIQLLECF